MNVEDTEKVGVIKTSVTVITLVDSGPRFFLVPFHMGVPRHSYVTSIFLIILKCR